jgi:dihydropteroate synthase
MGILNITPDSFSGDGKLDGSSHEQILTHAQALIEDGADIIDIGGESTRPGNKPVTEEEELGRVIPIIKSLRRTSNVVISIDTYKSAVAKAALAAGADMVNDVWALSRDSAMASVIAESKAPVILMHNRLSTAEQSAVLGGRFTATSYNDIISDIHAELQTSIDTARAAHIPDAHIIIDPGIGFGKSTEQNLELVRRMHEFRTDFPILVGPSRKSFVGYTLQLPPHERLEGTLAATTLLIERGADIVRVHDVRAARRAAALTDSITRSSRK